MTDLVIHRSPRRKVQKGPNSCENIGCVQEREPGRNKCIKHLSYQREYSLKYQQRKREENKSLKSQLEKLLAENLVLKKQIRDLSRPPAPTGSSRSHHA